MLDILQTYASNMLAGTTYTVEVAGVDNVPKMITFYRIEFTHDGFPKKETILDLEIKNKTKESSMVMIDNMIKAIKNLKELKPDKD